jgi:hypothetical protein
MIEGIQSPCPKRGHSVALLFDCLAAPGSARFGPISSHLTEDGLHIEDLPAVSAEELDEIFASGSLARERKTFRMDALGRFDEAAITWDISDPWIDRRAQALAERLCLDSAKLGQRQFKVIITHDLDRTTGFEPTAILNAILKAAGVRRSACLGVRETLSPCALVRNIERLLKYERAHGVGAYYFMMAGPYGWGRYSTRTDIRWKASRQIAKLVQQAGMTVGLHGSFDARERNSYGEEKDRVEQVIGTRINTHRNHYLRFDPEKLPSQMEAAGIGYDFSVGFGSHIGFRNGCAHVIRAYDFLNSRTSNLRSVPLLFMDTVYSRGNTNSVRASLRQALMKVRDVGGCVSLLFHPELFLVNSDGWSWFEEAIAICEELGADLSGVLPGEVKS